MRDIEAWGCRFAGWGGDGADSFSDGGMVVADCVVLVIVAVVVVVGGAADGEAAGCVAIFFGPDGGAAYVGCLGRKKFRIEDCPLVAFEEGTDMVWCWWRREGLIFSKDWRVRMSDA
jgi:hypothetical protein